MEKKKLLLLSPFELEMNANAINKSSRRAVDGDEDE